jgi:trigger factor
MPEENDEFAKKFEKNTIDDLKKAISEDIIKQKGIAENQKQENELMDEILKISKVEIPDSLVEQELNQMIERMKTQTQTMGMPFEKYLEQIKKSEADLRADMTVQAEKTVKTGLVLGEIGKQEKIDLKDKESVKKIISKIFEYTQK